MEPPKSLLVGVDFDPDGSLTPGSCTALGQAHRVAEHTGARLATLFGAPSGAELPPGARMAVESIAGSGVELEVAHEPPALALSRCALEGSADMVFVAKRNRSRRADRKLGSVTLELLRLCPCPVWAVRPEHPLHHRRVLAATDLSAVGDRATELGAVIAGAERCMLDVVHAWQRPMELQLSYGSLSPRQVAVREEKIVERAQAHIRAVPGVADLGERAHVYLACDAPASVVLAAVKAKDPDLVVMGTVSRGGLAGLVMGNTAERLLYLLECSTLTVKPADFVCPLGSGAEAVRARDAWR